MATVAQVREGIRVRLATITGLRTHAVMPAALNAPAAVVFRRTTTFDTSMDGESDDLTCGITLFVEFGNERTAQEALDAYLAPAGALSVKAAVDGDPTLGGVVDFARVAGAEADRIVEWSNIKYLAADLVVEVG
jgi:hypothetical protein